MVDSRKLPSTVAQYEARKHSAFSLQHSAVCESIGMAGSLHVSADLALAQHLLNGIAGDEVDEQKHDRDHQPHDGNQVEQTN